MTLRNSSQLRPQYSETACVLFTESNALGDAACTRVFSHINPDPNFLLFLTATRFNSLHTLAMLTWRKLFRVSLSASSDVDSVDTSSYSM